MVLITATDAVPLYYEQVRQLDKNRNTPYWATTHELFARAEAVYIYDKLEVKGIRNDYLVYGSDEQRYAEHPNGNPNPVGHDRETLAVHFNNLIDEYRINFINNIKRFFSRNRDVNMIFYFIDFSLSLFCFSISICSCNFLDASTAFSHSSPLKLEDTSLGL